MREVTQEVVDKWQSFFQALAIPPEPSKHDYGDMPNIKLAVYPNRMRDDGVFVGEDKPIEPYASISGFDGRPVYPSVPQTPYMIRGQLPHDFAYELVRRWNSFNG